jgi:hypothetical protein
MHPSDKLLNTTAILQTALTFTPTTSFADNIPSWNKKNDDIKI